MSGISINDYSFVDRGPNPPRFLIKGSYFAIENDPKSISILNSKKKKVYYLYSQIFYSLREEFGLELAEIIGKEIFYKFIKRPPKLKMSYYLDYGGAFNLPKDLDGNVLVSFLKKLVHDLVLDDTLDIVLAGNINGILHPEYFKISRLFYYQYKINPKGTQLYHNEDYFCYKKEVVKENLGFLHIKLDNGKIYGEEQFIVDFLEKDQYKNKGLFQVTLESDDFSKNIHLLSLIEYLDEYQIDFNLYSDNFNFTIEQLNSLFSSLCFKSFIFSGESLEDLAINAKHLNDLMGSELINHFSFNYKLDISKHSSGDVVKIISRALSMSECRRVFLHGGESIDIKDVAIELVKREDFSSEGVLFDKILADAIEEEGYYFNVCRQAQARVDAVAKELSFGEKSIKLSDFFSVEPAWEKVS